MPLGVALTRIQTLAQDAQAAADALAVQAGGWVSLRGAGAAGDGSDATLAFLSAIEQADDEGKALYIDPGEYKVTPGSISSGAGRLTIPSGMTVYGAGPASKVIMSGVAAAGDGGGFVYDLFRVAAGSSRILFRDFRIVGENTPFTYYSQNQSAGIGLETASSISDVVVDGVWFESLYGFWVHDPGENARVHVLRCHAKDCSNGCNVNANYSLQGFNSVENSEGFEFSGKHSGCCFNTIRNARGGAISAGGNTGVGARYPGALVGFNTIDGAVDGVGIVFGEATVDGACVLNDVRRCDNGGINISGGAGISRGNLVAVNVVSSNCKSGGSSLVGLNIQGTGKHHVVGNQCRDEGETGFEQRYALAVYAPNCSFSANRLAGTTQDVEFQSTATGTSYDSSNVHENGLVSIVAGATFVGYTQTTWDPPSLNAGTQTTTTVAVTGCKLGDQVSVGFDKDLQGMQLTGHVSVNGTVTVVLRNGTAGTIDLASGSLRVRTSRF